jgi:serine/threonine protein kinase
LAHYLLQEKIGEGGMGVVSGARDIKLGRVVAIKVLPPEKLSAPERKRRFVQEAQPASAMNHPNIVTVFSLRRASARLSGVIACPRQSGLGQA